MTEKRDKSVLIRFTGTEHEKLKMLSVGQTISAFIRGACLNQKPPKPMKKVDPNLLFELNKIGVNMNQIARQLNSKSRVLTVSEKVLMLEQLEQMSQNLEALVERHAS
jgi:hypothetical protein